MGQARQRVDRSHLGEDDQPGENTKPGQRMRERCGVNERADAHEKEHGEHVTQWRKPLTRFDGDRALADGEPGNERCQGKRQGRPPRGRSRMSS